MTTDAFTTAFGSLTLVQREAVLVGDGSVLVLAGPGSGKTQVLTCRIAKLLADSADESFKVLALTFTDKAAREMLTRVQTFVPGQEERTSVGTIHSFCAQVLRQHGIHLGLKPDFTIFSQDRDRQLLLEEGLQETARTEQEISTDHVRFLPIIDKLKVRLIDPASAAERLTKAKLTEAALIARVYQIYEAQLRKENALDFNSLIFESYVLFSQFPAIAKFVRRVYRYWLLDEFQDTTDGQYRLIKAMAGESFKNVFVVADDDQIIYQWNGASFRQIQKFTTEFEPKVIQLTKRRCPPGIVEAANRLVAYNSQRTTSKMPLVSGKTELSLPAEDHIRLVLSTTMRRRSKELLRILQSGQPLIALELLSSRAPARCSKKSVLVSLPRECRRSSCSAGMNFDSTVSVVGCVSETGDPFHSERMHTAASRVLQPHDRAAGA